MRGTGARRAAAGHRLLLCHGGCLLVFWSQKVLLLQRPTLLCPRLVNRLAETLVDKATRGPHAANRLGKRRARRATTICGDF